jgi:hypothetical protein
MARSHTATLCCGVVLEYEARSFLPRAGEVVPCRSHGYCPVAGTGAGARDLRVLPRAAPRTQRELLEWLGDRPVTTVAALRRQRFTLRMVSLAQRAGLVDVDVEAASVIARLDRGPDAATNLCVAVSEVSGSHPRRQHDVRMMERDPRTASA